MQLMHLACMLERRVEASSTHDDLSRALASLAALLSLASPHSTLKIAADSPEKTTAKGTKGRKKGGSATPIVLQLPAQAVVLRTLARILQKCLACMRQNVSSGVFQSLSNTLLMFTVTAAQ